MNKRKLLTLTLAICMAAILVVGGTMAYFTDEQDAENILTIGNVDIVLYEDYVSLSNLLPGVDVNKDVWVYNRSQNNDAYVRVHIAIPTVLDDGDPSFDASRNFLHWNFPADSFADGLWSWLPENSTGTGYKGNGEGNWNFYQTTVDGVEYNVYVATYRSALAPTEETPLVLDKVYLDASVDAAIVEDEESDDSSGDSAGETADGSAGEPVYNKDILYTDDKGNSVTMTAAERANIKILVYAEATQTKPFEDAYTALNTVFGVPGSEGYVDPWNK